MKSLSKYIGVLLLLAAPILLPASRTVLDLEECAEIIALKDVTPDISRRLSWGRLPNLAVVVHEGEEFPLGFFLKADFYSLAQDNSFKVKSDRTCYFRFISKDSERIQAYVSFDLEKWKKSKPVPKGEVLFHVDQGTVKAIAEGSSIK
ncbi:MAG: hypothetical protein LVR00_03630 [Rhabdochlamydiaceae bacterium]|jgi:hypothetical protein